MSDFDRKRVARLAKRLERALEDSSAMGADGVLGQMRSLFDRIAAGEVTAPIRRAPGGRHFLESNLREDPAVSSVWTTFCNAVEGKD